MVEVEARTGPDPRSDQLRGDVVVYSPHEEDTAVAEGPAGVICPDLTQRIELASPPSSRDVNLTFHRKSFLLKMKNEMNEN